ncbi:unnamed protein product [Ostreobium quekettii]|uniref:Thioredoxin domain-containing protein n=1 Tax=Ostreobium quekettii TaxID=121088 RepID=A0A8S1IZD6_9CHLO|nr:unnamed protein product [Ostreobium quekettii]|eukprot:evm.model.scf_26.17 EVM.evm.TU.scf_26.17   scf_26:142950-144728(+)
MDAQALNSTMQNIALGEAMVAAARDYKKEMEDAEAAAKAGAAHQEVDIDDLMDDPELLRLHEERAASIREEVERRAHRARLEEKGHGAYTEVEEGDFLELVTKTELVVVHFWHAGFDRCRIMDKHLDVLARKYVRTRFVKLSAEDAPFFTKKLKVMVLPCVIFFINGIATGRLVGFDELGGKDSFQTSQMEQRLLKAGVVAVPDKPESDSEDERESRIRRSMLGRQLDSSDEDSDFD